MLRIMTSNEVRKNWGTLMTSVQDGDEVIVKSRGVPKVVVISYERYLEFLEFRRERRRRTLMDQLLSGVSDLASRHADLQSDEFEERARLFSETFVAGLTDDDLLADG